MEYYENEKGQVAVLVSTGYGAGWSTWNQRALAYDKRVVEFWLSKKDDENFMKEIRSVSDNDAKKMTRELFESFGYTDVYFCGLADVVLVWVDKGRHFRIFGYDGYESIEFLEDDDYIVF